MIMPVRNGAVTRKEVEMKSARTIKPAATNGLPLPSQMNTRLVAAVQSRAGARCHTSANLLQCYYFCAEVYRVQLRNNDPVATEAARRSMQRAETRLREFLTEMTWNGRSEEAREASPRRQFAAAC
jgi:hypothetical protein